MKSYGRALFGLVGVAFLLLAIQLPAASAASPPSGQSVVTYKDYPAGTPQPLAASGCNGRVCTYLSGSGLTVSQWRTTAVA